MTSPDVALILLQHANGTVGIMHFVLNDHRSVIQVATDDNIQAEIDRSSFDSPVVFWRRTILEEIPADRSFRNAWAYSDKAAVPVDMDKAREIQRQRFRLVRDPLLADLDVTQLRALATDDKAAVADIETQKQALRDVTEDPAIDAAQTPEELKAVLPAALSPKADAGDAAVESPTMEKQ